MSLLDWIVLIFTTVLIIGYGLWKGRGKKDSKDYFLAGNTLPWYTIALSIISTQASAITFLSVPGQAYTDGMRFVLFYLGLPIAMIVLSASVVPLYYRLKVYTAYEFLEARFDLRTRSFIAFLFLVQRGLATGISVAAPAIVLSVILQWEVFWINLFLGGIVLTYIVSGGSKAVSYTQQLQTVIILSGMAIAGYLVFAMLPKEMSFSEALQIAGKTGKLNTMDFSFDWQNRYNLWTGLIGGFFLQMSYFGTDQSQVGRYLGGASIAQSRLALLFNGIFKIPMQFGILFIGVMLFVFYQFHQAPLFFNPAEISKIQKSEYVDEYKTLEEKHQKAFENKKEKVKGLLNAMQSKNKNQLAEAEKSFHQAEDDFKAVRNEALALMKKNDKDANTNDTNYIFLSFVLAFLPSGLIGLLLVVVFFSSMTSTSSQLNALASTSVLDIYKRTFYSTGNEKHYIRVTEIMTVVWGIITIFLAQLASRMGTLIEAVNILGSLFYGTILGVFLLAFYFKSVQAKAAFWAAVMGEILVLLIYFEFFGFQVAYLWLNMIGCVAVIALALLIGLFVKDEAK